MSIASPTLRSSSSTVPGPSLSRSPISIRARPSTAETLTGTSNTASRSAAIRVVGPSGSVVTGISGGAARASRLGGVTRDAAVRPFDPAVAHADAGLAEHDEPTFEAVQACDLVELLARGGIDQ